MNAKITTPSATSLSSGRGTATPPGSFEKPSPGAWVLDASHCERPFPRCCERPFTEMMASAMRDSAKAFGALLDTIDCATVNGFAYTCVRPLGAPPEAKGPPPKAIIKLLSWLHPEIRRRNRRAEEVFRDKLWRKEIEQYRDEWRPPVDAMADRLRSADLRRLADDALGEHVLECFRLAADQTRLHFRLNLARVVPVGDLIVHVQRWAGPSATDVLEMLRGHSPDSELGLRELEQLAQELRSNPEVCRRIQEAPDPEALMRELESRTNVVGDATRAWVHAVGHIPTGFSSGYPTLRETPATMIASLRAALGGNERDEPKAAAEAAAKRLRARIPPEHHAEFDRLLEEARFIYPLRDETCMRTLAAFGILRLGLFELGRRLTASGRIAEPEAALELDAAEVKQVLEGGGPSAEELAKRLDWRRTATSADAPELLGPPPGAPPPAEWLPPAAARLARAVDVYIQGMFKETDEMDAEALVISGLAASGGKVVGPARLVLEPGDFDRVQPGDILVARITTPTYNVLLPLLAGIVTDRGGVLSHPAIVSREYGIPGVVGTKIATTTIPDGATVEIDGQAGTVRILSAS